MKKGQVPRIALVTAPDMAMARKLARAALEARLVACVNIMPRIESHYWWQGKLEKSGEVLLILKTSAGRLRSLERVILDLHPYDTPEFVVLSVDYANPKYLAWWLDSLPSGG